MAIAAVRQAPGASSIPLFAGQHRVPTGGTVKVKATPDNLPARRKAWLHRQTDGRLVREVWSDAVTGAYAFDAIADGVYYVVVFDYTQTYEGEVVTGIAAEAMPWA